MSKALKKILIKSKKQVFSEILGNNSSLLKGEGYDFLELKEYEYGDEVKNIDWVISAKMQKPYVKVFHAQKELNIHIVSILTGSCHFGTSKFKQEVISEICAILSFSCIKQGDPFYSYIANEDINIITKKSKKLFSVQTFVTKVNTYNCLKHNIDYLYLSKTLCSTIKRKSLIFLIGDFMDIKDIDLKMLSKKHEVIAIIVRDKFEEEPQFLGNINLVDPKNNKTFDGSLSKSAINEYKQEILKNDHLLYEHFQKCAIKFKKIYTHEDTFSKIISLLRA